jgi:hypothetical protein
MGKIVTAPCYHSPVIASTQYKNNFKSNPIKKSYQVLLLSSKEELEFKQKLNPNKNPNNLKSDHTFT